MKNNIKALQLVEVGLSSKTVSKLTESQIEVLHNRLINEQPQPRKTTKQVELVDLPPGAQTTMGNLSITNKGGVTQITKTNEELGEENDFDLDSDQAYTGQQGSHDEYQSADDGMDDDTSPENKDKRMVGMTEDKKGVKKNPWAICTAQLGDEFGTTERSEWSKTQMKKYERCVMDVKKSLKEGKNPVSLYLESQIMKIVEKNLPPRITKGELMKYLTEDETTTAPSKPGTKEKPGTTEKPSTRPKHPGQKPKNVPNPAPKAKNVSPEVAKGKIIDAIMKLLEK